MSVTLDVLNAVAEIGLLCAAGAALAKTGILDARGRHTLAQAAYHAFMPALCFTSLARAADVKSLAAWAPLLYNMGAAIGTGWLVGWVTADVVVRPPPALRGHVIAAAGFGNVANLLLVLCSGLCRGPAARAALLLPGSAAAVDPAACEALGAAYVMTPVLVATLAQLLAVEALLRRKDEEGDGGGGGGGAGEADAALPAVSELVPLAADGMERGGGWPSSATTAAGSRHASPAKAAAAARAAALAGTPSGVGLPTITTPSTTNSPPTWPVRAWGAARYFLSGLARPPSAATLAGIAVGCTPPAKAVLFGGGGGGGGAPPLAALTAALTTLGAAMVPVILVGLGAELAGDGGGGGSGEDAAAAYPPTPPLPARAYVASVFARLVVMPCLGVAALAAARRSGLYRPVDGLFDVVAHLAWATPAAAILVLIASRERNAPRAMARLLLASYAGSAVSLPVFMAGLLRWVVVGTRG